MPTNVLAAAAPVAIRPAGSIVRSVNTTSYSLPLRGVSEIVRDRASRFLAEIERNWIKVAIQPRPNWIQIARRISGAPNSTSKHKKRGP